MIENSRNYSYKYCSYPDKALGWIDGEYHPRDVKFEDCAENRSGILEFIDDIAVFYTKVWRETEDTGYGVYFYEEAPCIVFRLDNADYDVTLVLANPTNMDYRAHVRANGIVKDKEIIVESGREKVINFKVPVYTGELKLLALSGFLSEVSENKTEGKVYIKGFEVKECEKKANALKPTLFLASDSTVQSYGDRDYPQTGWGQVLPLFFQPEKDGENRHPVSKRVELDSLIIDNRSIAARSSKSFIEEGRFDDLLLSLNEGDFVMIQWAHNDSNRLRPNRYVSLMDYPRYLQYYIDGIKQRGATPVLVTAIAMRNCGETGEFSISFPEYRELMIESAVKNNVPLIDLGKKSCDVVKEHGVEGSKNIFLWVKAGQYPNSVFAGGCSDNAHLQVYGAMLFANLVAESIKEYDTDEKLDPLKKIVCPRAYIENMESDGLWEEEDNDEAVENGLISGFVMHELSVDSGRANFLLNWDNVRGAFIYRIYNRNKDKEKDFSVVRDITVKEKESAATMPFATSVGLYEYYVAALDENGKEIAVSKILDVKAV